MRWRSPLETCLLVGVGRTAKYTDCKGTTTVKKGYQKEHAAAANVEATMPDAVTVTLPELAGSLREGLLAMAVGAGFRSWTHCSTKA